MRLRSQGREMLEADGQGGGAGKQGRTRSWHGSTATQETAIRGNLESLISQRLSPSQFDMGKSDYIKAAGYRLSPAHSYEYGEGSSGLRWGNYSAHADKK